MLELAIFHPITTTAPVAVADRATLATYPQLHRLTELRDAGGWIFHLVRVDGELHLLVGTRMWPLGWSDAIAIRDVGDAKAFRCDPDGDEVWTYEGGLADVIDAVMELPAPDDPKAPRLVKARGSELRLPS